MRENLWDFTGLTPKHLTQERLAMESKISSERNKESEERKRKHLTQEKGYNGCKNWCYKEENMEKKWGEWSIKCREKKMKIMMLMIYVWKLYELSVKCYIRYYLKGIRLCYQIWLAY